MVNYVSEKYVIVKGVISNGVGEIGFLRVNAKGVITMVTEPSRGQRRKRYK